MITVIILITIIASIIYVNKDDASIDDNSHNITIMLTINIIATTIMITVIRIINKTMMETIHEQIKIKENISRTTAKCNRMLALIK